MLRRIIELKRALLAKALVDGATDLGDRRNYIDVMVVEKVTPPLANR